VRETPTTQYVEVDGSDVAFQVLGEGPVDLVYFYGIGAHIEMYWDAPLARPFLRRLASFSRLILFNRRGTGASDGVPRTAIPTWEEWAEDLLAVLDAAGVRRAALFATLDGGPIALLFAAMHPERVSALILQTTTARYLRSDDYPIGASDETVDAVIKTIESTWGTPELLAVINPSMAENTAFLEYGARWFRASATPRSAAAQFDYMLHNLDVREALPLVQAPTLVIHVHGSALLPIAHGRYLAEHIAGARLVELPGGDTAITPQNYVIADDVAEFLTGYRPELPVDRVLTTVVFSDIVGSTQLAAAIGDARWRALLDAHDQVIRNEFRRFRGEEVNTTGDGFVSSFDGPARAIRCADAMIKATSNLGIRIRVGLHTGECAIRGKQLGGLAVHIAARVGALSEASQILVSSTVKDLVAGSGIEFEDQGTHTLKGVPNAWRLYSVRANSSEAALTSV
jgi:class 3 adenylate cyclase